MRGGRVESVRRGLVFVGFTTISKADGPLSETSDLAAPDADEVRELRERYYNATIIERIDSHEELTRLRVRPDEPIPAFEAGQYVAMGLGYWEPRLRGTQPEDVPAKRLRKVVRRAYSISCPMLDTEGNLAPVDTIDYFEFYVTLVREGPTPKHRPPALTPRLFGKQVGDRLVVERKVTGKYRLGEVGADDTVLFMGTGTGEAPHNAMATTLLARGHRGRIINATSIRVLGDAAYRGEHAALMERYPQYRYFALTTREPENVDPAHPNYVGKLYLQQLFSSGQLSEMAEDPLDPARTHVFLCGNPDMIGLVPPGGTPLSPPGMLPLLLEAGFRDEPGGETAGCIRYEKYW